MASSSECNLHLQKCTKKKSPTAFDGATIQRLIQPYNKQESCSYYKITLHRKLTFSLPLKKFHQNICPQGLQLLSKSCSNPTACTFFHVCLPKFKSWLSLTACPAQHAAQLMVEVRSNHKAPRRRYKQQ